MIHLLRRGSTGLLLLIAIGICSPAQAQQDLGRLERQLEEIHRDQYLRIDQSIPSDRRALFDYGAYVTASYLSVDDQNNNNHVLREYDIVGYANLNIDNVQQIFIRGRTGYQDFNAGDSFDGRGDTIIDPDFERAFYRLDLGRAAEAYHGQEPDTDLVLQAGRDLAYWGNGLVLSETLDGITAHFTSDPIDIDVIAGITPVRTVDFDTSRPDFDHNSRRGFYGVQISKQIGRHHPYVYALMQRDYNEDDHSISLTPDGETINTRYRYDSYYLGAGSTGSITDRFLYGVEAAYEGGYGLSNSYQIIPGTEGSEPTVNPIDQSDDPIHAFAADVRLDYLFGDARQTRLSAEALIASGDPDRLTSSTNTFGGNRSGTGDDAFNAFGFLNTGVAFAPAVSNLSAVRVGFSTLPFAHQGVLERLQIGSDVLAFAKTQRDAQIDEATSSDHRYLGWEPDLFMNWQITNDVTLAVRYGIFFPGDAITNDDKDRQFFFAGVTYAF